MTNAFPGTDLMGVFSPTKGTVVSDAHAVSRQNGIAFSGPVLTCPGAPGRPPAGPQWGRRPSGWWAHGSRGRPAGPQATGISLGPGSRLPSRPCLCRLEGNDTTAFSGDAPAAPGCTCVGLYAVCTLGRSVASDSWPPHRCGPAALVVSTHLPVQSIYGMLA